MDWTVKQRNLSSFRAAPVDDLSDFVASVKAQAKRREPVSQRALTIAVEEIARDELLRDWQSSPQGRWLIEHANGDVAPTPMFREKASGPFMYAAHVDIEFTNPFLGMDFWEQWQG